MDNEFGQALRRYRLAAGLTQREAAEFVKPALPKAGSAHVSGWETGVNGIPSNEVIRLLEDGLQIPDHDLLRKAGRLIEAVQPPTPPGGERRSGPIDRRTPNVREIVREELRAELQAVRGEIAGMAGDLGRLEGRMADVERLADAVLRPGKARRQAGGGGRS